MIVSDHPAFIYARVPKTASSSISTALEPYRRQAPGGLIGAALRRLPLPPRLKGRVLNYRANPHLTLAAARAYLDPAFFDRALKFAAVRHPVDWLVSYHRHLIRSDAPRHRAHFAEVCENPEFDFFIDWLAGRMPMPQINMLIAPDGSFLAERVIRLERLSDEIAPVLGELGLEIEVPYLNRGGYSPPDIPAATRAKIERMFEADFHHLGYGPEGIVGAPDLAPSALSRRHGADLGRIGPTRYKPFRPYPQERAA